MLPRHPVGRCGRASSWRCGLGTYLWQRRQAALAHDPQPTYFEDAEALFLQARAVRP